MNSSINSIGATEEHERIGEARKAVRPTSLIVKDVTCILDSAKWKLKYV
jgi:hypothetical protein